MKKVDPALLKKFERYKRILELRHKTLENIVKANKIVSDAKIKKLQEVLKIKNG